MTTTTSRTSFGTRGARTALVLTAAAVVAVAANAAIAAVAVRSGAPAGYGPLTVPAQALFTVLGIGVGWAAWRAVHTRAQDPRGVLRWLVPVVTVASFAPDLLLLTLRFIPGTTTAAVVALMAMHVVVAVCAVTAYVTAGPGVRR